MKNKMIALLAAAAILTLFAGCGGSDMYNGAADSGTPQRDANYEVADAEAAYDYGDDGNDMSSALPTFLDTDNAMGIRLVYTVDLKLQTTAFPQGTRRLLEAVDEAGGFVRSTYVEGRSLYTPDAARYASYTLSIPTDELAGFLVKMEDEFNLVRLSQSSQDITKQHTGGNLELDALREQEAGLLSAIDGLEEDDAQRAQLEATLSSVRAQINALTVEVDGMDIDIHYSTVTVELFEVVDVDLAPGEEGSFGEQARQTAGNSVNRLVAFLQGLLLWLLAAWPVLLLLCLLAVAAVVVVRLTRKGRLGDGMRKLLGMSDADGRETPDDSGDGE